MDRRQFLSGVGAAAGYTLGVFVGGAGPASAGDVSAIGSASAEAGSPAAPARGPVPTSGSGTDSRPDSRFEGEARLALLDSSADVLVAGGGMAGVVAALAAARSGANVILVQDRSRLGGNASSEVRMHIVGADVHGARPGWREGGILEELRLDDAVGNPHRSWELWDLLLYDKVAREPRIRLLLDTAVVAAELSEGRIQRVLARSERTETIHRIQAAIFVDATGDARLGLEAGAELLRGREGRAEFGESLAREEPDWQTLGSSILFTARDQGRPAAFRPPPWARKVRREDLRLRPVGSWEYGYWWIEWGGQLDTVRDDERIRRELLAIVLGVWDHIKNSGEHPSSANWAMDWIGMIPGRRESRRIVGEHVLTQADLEGKNGRFDDAVAIGGWPLDDHPPDGFDRSETPPARSIALAEPYDIPLRALYSRNVANLMMAGRNISTSHVALSSTRVMGTCAALGQAVGTAAAICTRLGIVPRTLAHEPERRRELRQALLRDDQTILALANEDPADLAREARVRASAEHEGAAASHIIDGFVRDRPSAWEHRWAAPLGEDGAWIELEWDRPRSIREVQITFDTGFQRQLTLTAQDGQNRKIIRGPQPECVRDYRITATEAEGRRHVLAEVAGNHQRLRRHAFDPVLAKSLQVRIDATNGSDTARIYEIRCYA